LFDLNCFAVGYLVVGFLTLAVSVYVLILFCFRWNWKNLYHELVTYTLMLRILKWTPSQGQFLS